MRLNAYGPSRRTQKIDGIVGVVVGVASGCLGIAACFGRLWDVPALFGCCMIAGGTLLIAAACQRISWSKKWGIYVTPTRVIVRRQGSRVVLMRDQITYVSDPPSDWVLVGTQSEHVSLTSSEFDGPDAIRAFIQEVKPGLVNMGCAGTQSNRKGAANRRRSRVRLGDPIRIVGMVCAFGVWLAMLVPVCKFEAMALIQAGCINEGIIFAVAFVASVCAALLFGCGRPVSSFGTIVLCLAWIPIYTRMALDVVRVPVGVTEADLRDIREKGGAQVFVMKEGGEGKLFFLKGSVDKAKVESELRALVRDGDE